MFNEEIAESYPAKLKRETLDIPEFLNKEDDYLDNIDEISQAILNNTPGNTDIEEMNHLNELERVADNWKDAEWQRVLYYCPHEMLTQEIGRRLKADDVLRSSIKDLGGFLAQVKM